MMTPDKNQTDRIIEKKPGSVMFPRKYWMMKNNPIKMDNAEIPIPNPTKSFNGLSEKERITFTAKESNLEKL